MQELRKAMGLTQQEFAEKLGIDRTTVAKWEQGRSVPRVDMLQRIASLLNCSLETVVASLAKLSPDDGIADTPDGLCPEDEEGRVSA